MDEPTSGLDARAAAIVMRTVRNTVDIGRTVVCTIHQPSINIFGGFDELFLLKRGGQEIYVGPLGHRSCHLVKYFQDMKWLWGLILLIFTRNQTYTKYLNEKSKVSSEMETKKVVSEMEELPKTIVRRVVKDKLNECSPDTDITVNKDSLLAFLESTPIFIHYLSAT
ncbi:hypothetical protein Pint_29969 [Pistacia integerrima]|uniref:Uncharacterized protein n=1 Tax=Pistacia integerrima TaxID=434235 RepID=A0ACC0X2U8_9ROSI|nr:hypothetical protein Pint_29969 [Pistacia integerrima]